MVPVAAAPSSDEILLPASEQCDHALDRYPHGVHETPADLAALQRLLDASYARIGAHIEVKRYRTPAQRFDFRFKFREGSAIAAGKDQVRAGPGERAGENL